jgi:hypothetical protein
MTTWYAPYVIILLLALSADGAFAQGTQAACFEVFTGSSKTRFAGAILLNRCSGQTWILVRSYQPAPKGRAGQPVYRWNAIASDVAIPKPSTDAPVAAAGDKCFIFQGRRFCE